MCPLFIVLLFVLPFLILIEFEKFFVHFGSNSLLVVSVGNLSPKLLLVFPPSLKSDGKTNNFIVVKSIKFTVHAFCVLIKIIFSTLES